MPVVTHNYAFTADLNDGMRKPVADVSLGAGDALGDKVSVTLTQGGAAVTLTGMTAKGYFTRADNATVYIDGTVSGSTVSVTLPEECYAYDGAFTFALKLEDETSAVTILYMLGSVIMTDAGRIVDPGTVFPSYAELMAMIDGKIDEPAEEGTAGMVLTTDGNGGRSWQDISASTVAGTLKVNDDTYVIRTGSSGASGYLTIVTEA